MRILCCIIWVCSSWPTGILAQSGVLGLPPITYYSKTEYQGGTQNWDFAQDAAGRIFIANNEGMLVFNGTQWAKFPIANGTCVRAVAVGQNQDIYVGGQGEIGYFKPDAIGKLKYESLVAKIPLEARQFADVWDIEILANGDVFFRSDFYVFRWQVQKSVFSVLAIKSYFLDQYEGKVVLQDEHYQLLKFERDSFRAFTGHPSLKSPVSGLLPRADGTTTITSVQQGLFTLTGNAMVPLKTQRDIFLQKKRISAAALLPNDVLALSTAFGGLLLLDKTGKEILHLQKEDGLVRNNTISAFIDQAKNLFIGLDNGLAYIEMGAPFYYLQPDKENNSGGYAAAVHRQKLYLGTSNGLYCTAFPKKTDKKTNFELVSGTNGQVWSLDVIDDALLMGHHEGAFRIDPLATRWPGTTGSWKFLSLQPATTLLGHYNGISLLENDKKSLHKPPFHFPALKESSRVMVLDAAQQIWISHPYRGVFKAQLLPDNSDLVVELLGEKEGLPTQLNNYVYKIGNEVLFGTENGVYRYNNKRFEPANDYNQKIDAPGRIRLLKKDSLDNIWYCKGQEVGVIWKKSPSTKNEIGVQRFHNLAPKLVGGFESMVQIADSSFLFGTEQGFLLLDLPRLNAFNDTVTVNITSVLATGKKDSLLRGGFGPNPLIELTYKQNSLAINFSSPIFGQTQGLNYSTKLKGLEKEWTAWNSNSSRSFSSLPAGDYSFLVKVRNEFGVESEVAQLNITIYPPWYSSLLARCVYLALFIFGIGFLFRKQKKHYQAEKEEMSFQYQQQTLEQQQQVAAAKQAVVQLENEKLEAEVAYKNQELALATLHLVQKAAFLNTVQEELQSVSDKLKDPQLKTNIKKLVRTLQMEEHVDDNWEQFAVHFDKVHGDFIKKIHEKHPQLTPNDHRLCVYLYLNLSTKEIANMLNISIRGVEGSRYRLRKKLGIANDANLTLFMQDI